MVWSISFSAAGGAQHAFLAFSWNEETHNRSFQWHSIKSILLYSRLSIECVCHLFRYRNATEIFAPILHINGILPIGNNRQWTITNELDIKYYNIIIYYMICDVCTGCCLYLWHPIYFYVIQDARIILCDMLYSELWWSLSITNAWLRNELLISIHIYSFMLKENEVLKYYYYMKLATVCEFIWTACIDL